jgi:8-amino-7-oxononanoate synthase
MYFEVFGDREGCGPGEVRMGRRKVLMFGSNDYLGLITHPKVIEAAAQAVHKYGTGCSGSRLLNGTLDLHVKLEAELAALVHKEAAIMFSTGFQGNYGTLSALTEKGDVMICDHNLHASLVEGALRSPARTVRFRHNDMDHFERCLENCPPDERILIVSEGVFSMEGDIADLRGTLKLAKPYGARVYVDEAHGIGVLGPTGAGAAERSVIDYLKHTSRPFVFSASLPAASVAAVAAALQIMKKEPERRHHLLRIAQMLRDELRSRGFSVLPGETAIVPVVIQDELDLCRLCKALLDEGIYINPVLRPAAAQNLLRISCTAAHTEKHLDRLITTLERVSNALGIER